MKSASKPQKSATGRFGAHMSIAGGVWNALDRAHSAGCDVLQIFTKSTNSWAAKPLTDEDLRLFRERSTGTGIRPVAAHTSYLLNLASPDQGLWQKSHLALLLELERCEALGIPFLVLHPGAHMGAGESAGLRRIATALDQVHASSRGFHSRVLLENTAGQGTCVGHRFESLEGIISRVKEPERLGVCIDTCHLFAAGYDLRSEAGYRETMEELERRIGLERVGCVHTNDSKKPRGSRVDRHEHIGKGHIGLEGFRRILEDPRFREIPFILETPKEGEMDEVNLAVLRRLSAGRRGTKKSPGERPRGKRGMGN